MRPKATKPNKVTIPASEEEPESSLLVLVARVANEREKVELMEASSGIKRMVVIDAVAVNVHDNCARSPRFTTLTAIVDITVLLLSWQG